MLNRCKLAFHILLFSFAIPASEERCLLAGVILRLRLDALGAVAIVHFVSRDGLLPVLLDADDVVPVSALVRLSISVHSAIFLIGVPLEWGTFRRNILILTFVQLIDAC